MRKTFQDHFMSAKDGPPQIQIYMEIVDMLLHYTRTLFCSLTDFRNGALREKIELFFYGRYLQS